MASLWLGCIVIAAANLDLKASAAAATETSSCPDESSAVAPSLLQDRHVGSGLGFWRTPVPGIQCPDDKFIMTGHSDPTYDGEYLRAADWANKTQYRNKAGKHIYLYRKYNQCDDGPAGCCWNFDATAQTGANKVGDLYGGGYMSSVSACDGRMTLGANTVEGVPRKLALVVSASQSSVTISGHPRPLFNGVYERSANWTGTVRYTARTGMHLYRFSHTHKCDSDEAGACWNFDKTDQSNETDVRDFFGGGYFSTPSPSLASGSVLAELPSALKFSCSSAASALTSNLFFMLVLCIGLHLQA